MSELSSSPSARRFGRDSARAGVRVNTIAVDHCFTVIARRGHAQALRDHLAALLGAQPPVEPRWQAGRDCTLIWAGPDQWLIETSRSAPVLDAMGSAELAQWAAVSDQSDSRLTWELGGEHVVEVLEKGVPIDLHPSRFTTGDVAWTRVEHIDILLRRLSDAPLYRISVARSFGSSWWHWLEASSAPFGCEVLPAY